MFSSLSLTSRPFSLTPKSGDRPPGRPLDVDRWRSFCLVVAQLHKAGSVQSASNITALKALIEEEMKIPFSDDTLSTEVSWLWHHLRKTEAE